MTAPPEEPEHRHTRAGVPASFMMSGAGRSIMVYQ
jgi:hypothetical protein